MRELYYSSLLYNLKKIQLFMTQDDLTGIPVSTTQLLDREVEEESQSMFECHPLDCLYLYWLLLLFH